MEFYDFDVEIGRGSGRDYPVKVHSPTGEPSGTMRFPFDSLELKNHLQAVEIALLRSGGTRRDIASDEERTVQDFGQQLFDALLNNRVREGFRRSRDRARTDGKGLRVRLRIEAPELASLPWEFLYDADEGDYICLSTDTPIIRYTELTQPPEALRVKPPLHVLGMVASPNDCATLKVNQEVQRIEAALGRLTRTGKIQFTWLEGQGWRDLQRAMRESAYHVFHFVGHGGFDASSREGLIALVDDDGGGTYRLQATNLGRLLAGRHSLRLVVLNSCEGARGSKLDIFSSTASILIRKGIPAVVAMQYEITDDAAVEFSRSFYEALAFGWPIDMAVAEARKAVGLRVNNTVEWGTPVLHMRSPDGVLFRIEEPTPSPPKPVEPSIYNEGESPAGAASSAPVKTSQAPTSREEDRPGFTAASNSSRWRLLARWLGSWPVQVVGTLIFISLVILSFKALQDSRKWAIARALGPLSTPTSDSAYNQAFDLYIGRLSGKHSTRDLSNARDSLSELIRLHPTSYRVADALFAIGTSFIPTSPDSAEYYFESVVKRHPESYRTAAALYLVGNYREGRDDTTAKQIYQQVVRDYPVSPWHDFAIGRLRELSKAAVGNDAHALARERAAAERVAAAWIAARTNNDAGQLVSLSATPFYFDEDSVLVSPEDIRRKYEAWIALERVFPDPGSRIVSTKASTIAELKTHFPNVSPIVSSISMNDSDWAIEVVFERENGHRESAFLFVRRGGSDLKVAGIAD